MKETQADKMRSTLRWVEWWHGFAAGVLLSVVVGWMTVAILSNPHVWWP